MAKCHIFSDSVEAVQPGFGPHAKEILADIPSCTDLHPAMQIGEVGVGRAQGAGPTSMPS